MSELVEWDAVGLAWAVSIHSLGWRDRAIRPSLSSRLG
jgi:hypothetical protein